MALRPGLVSITFRHLNVAEVVSRAVDAGLISIEWGGDVHVPHGDLNAARRAAAATRGAGLRVAAYGSYYRLGVSESDGLAFAAVLRSARALGAPVVRVWAGPNNPKGRDAPDDPALFDVVAADLRRVGAMAADAGVVVALEYHPSTFTADAGNALRLLDTAGSSSAVRSLWQPNPFEDQETQGASLEAVLPYLQHVHAFAWTVDSKDRRAARRPFSEHAQRWSAWLSRIAAGVPGRDVDVLLEFVRDDNPAQLVEDAAALREVLQAITPG